MAAIGQGENVGMTLGLVGVQSAQYPINTIYLWTSGPEEAVLQVQLDPKAGIRVADPAAAIEWIINPGQVAYNVIVEATA